jgi:TatD DNase family protein
MRLIDVHAHLQVEEFAADLADAVERAAGAGVYRIIAVGTDLASSRRGIELARSFPGRVYAAVGIHPNSVAAASPDDLPELARLARLPEAIAVGETGLDFHRSYTPAEDQVHAFEWHVELAAAVGKPLGRARGFRHCFDGSAQVAERYVELGFCLSLAGTVTRDGHRRLKAAVQALPGERMLLETDCPYQSPASRAGQRNEPAFIVETLAAVAGLRGEPTEQVAEVTTQNALGLFAW